MSLPLSLMNGRSEPTMLIGADAISPTSLPAVPSPLTLIDGFDNGPSIETRVVNLTTAVSWLAGRSEA